MPEMSKQIATKSKIKMKHFYIGNRNDFSLSVALNRSVSFSLVREVKHLSRKDKAVCEILLTGFLKNLLSH